MNYSKILPFDLSNGEGIRVSLFVSGCKFHCSDCFNQEAQTFDYGKPYTNFTHSKIVGLVSHPYVAGLSILGGDPLWQNSEDMERLSELVYAVHQLNKTVWIWSGFTWEEVMADFYVIGMVGTSAEIRSATRKRHNLVQSCDVFVDGRYKKDLKDLTLKWRGSSNQRVIDVQTSIKKGEVILYNN